MMKKIAILATAGAILLSVAGPALGWWGGWSFGGSSDLAVVENEAEAESETGDNEQQNVGMVGGSGFGDVTVMGGNMMYTGDAVSGAEAVVVANTHVGCCEEADPCEDPCKPDPCAESVECGGEPDCGCPHDDEAYVENEAEAESETGDNFQGNAGEVMVMGGVGGCTFGGFCGGWDSDDVVVLGENWMSTGNALSGASAWTVVNTHLWE